MDNLIARLEKATGPDRELDVDIHAAINPTDYQRRFMNCMAMQAKGDPKAEENARRRVYVPEYTASIDAALTLVPEGYAADITRYSTAIGDARVWRNDTLTEVHSTRTLTSRPANAAIALCIASLRARAALKARKAVSEGICKTSTKGD